jgi:hypothetical protein
MTRRVFARTAWLASMGMGEGAAAPVPSGSCLPEIKRLLARLAIEPVSNGETLAARVSGA